MSERMSTRELIGRGIACRHLMPSEICSKCALDLAKEDERTLAASQATVKALVEAASKWPRCCDLWQDSLGGMHCNDCEQKTFAMLRDIQYILGLGKDGKAKAASKKGEQAGER